MKKSAKTIRIYRLKDHSIDEVVDCYMHHHKKGTLKGFEWDSWFKVGINLPSPKLLNKPNEHKKHTSVLAEKFTYLIHLIYNRQIENGGKFVSLNAKALENIFGKDYNSMLKILFRMGLLHDDKFFIEGKKAIGYRFKDEVEFTYTEENPNYLSKYRDKAKKELEKYLNSKEIEDRKLFDNNLLYDRYKQSLKILKLKYEDECEQFIKFHIFINNKSREYYNQIVYKYQSYIPTITIDKNKRIYHIGTSTPRLLKPFLNIKFQSDIHNSHPLLFCSLIFDYYDIPLSLRKIISSIINILNIPPHNVRRNIRKILINNNIDKNKIANIPNDVLEYIYLTSKGLFWESVLSDRDEDNLILRSDIKVLLFREVFYSKKLTTRGKKYGKMFRNRFPNVYKIVRSYKKGDRTWLANEMMRIESELFHEILMKLYNKRFKVISIHDAIVVLDTKANENCTVEIVEDIIKKIYLKRGLSADISTDMYNYSDIEKIISNEKKANELINSFLTDISDKAQNGDEEAKILMERLNTYELEVIPNKDYSDVCIHKLRM